LIFLAALPFCTVIWAFRLIQHMTLPTLGPIQSAISEARTITPRIFQT
jgi:TRAP-type C4-dicarboxylate transport system permease small subunit